MYYTIWRYIRWFVFFFLLNGNWHFECSIVKHLNHSDEFWQDNSLFIQEIVSEILTDYSNYSHEYNLQN